MSVQSGRNGGAVVCGIAVEDLPPPNTRRWVSSRKAKVVEAVRTGLMSLTDACDRYNLSVEEFLSWQRLIDAHGTPGLRSTRLQVYRAVEPAARSARG